MENLKETQLILKKDNEHYGIVGTKINVNDFFGKELHLGDTVHIYIDGEFCVETPIYNNSGLKWDTHPTVTNTNKEHRLFNFDFNLNLIKEKKTSCIYWTDSKSKNDYTTYVSELIIIKARDWSKISINTSIDEFIYCSQ